MTPMMIVSSDELPGYRITKVLGLVREVIERKRHVLRHAFQQFDNLLVERIQLVIMDEYRADAATALDQRQCSRRAAISLMSHFVPRSRALVVEKVVADTWLLGAICDTHQSLSLRDRLVDGDVRYP